METAAGGVEGAAARLGTIVTVHRDILIRVFHDLDRQGKAVLDRRELHRALTQAGCTAPPEDVDVIFDSAEDGGWAETVELKSAMATAAMRQAEAEQLQRKPMPPPVRQRGQARTPRSGEGLVDSARRTFDPYFGRWERQKRKERLDSAHRRMDVGLSAAPVPLEAHLHAVGRDRARDGHEREVFPAADAAPVRDLSQAVSIYLPSDRKTQTAAFLSLRIKELAAPLPHAISRGLPGSFRPYSRELSAALAASPVPRQRPSPRPRALLKDGAVVVSSPRGVASLVAIRPPHSGDALATRPETSQQAGRPPSLLQGAAPGASSLPPGPGGLPSLAEGDASVEPPDAEVGGGEAEGGTTSSLRPLVPPVVGRLPARWASLCAEREAQIEGLINLALRLQAYSSSPALSAASGGASGGHAASPPVRAAAVLALANLRRTSLAIVEALVAWRAHVSADAARRAAVAEAAAEKAASRTLRRAAPSGDQQQATYPAAEATKPPPATATVGGLTTRPATVAGGEAQPQLFSSYSLRFARTPPYGDASPRTGKSTREAAGLWDGLNYLLKMASDVWRLPLPTVTDPFALRWFVGTDFDATHACSPAEIERMMDAETAFRRLFTRALASPY